MARWLYTLAAVPAIALASPEDSLQNTLQELKQTEQEAKAAAERVHSVTQEIEQLQQQAGQLVSQIRGLHDDIDANETEIAALKIKLDERKAALDVKKAQMGNLLHGMIRMQRLPRQFVLARPDNTEELLQTASALNITYSATQQRAAVIRDAYGELQSLDQTLQARKAELRDDLAAVERKQSELKQTVAKRQTLQKQYQQDHQQVQTRVHRLSQESKSLKQLIAKLEKETSLFTSIGAPLTRPEAPQRPTSFVARKGALPYPAPGRLLHRYGEKQGPGERYRGNIIQTRPGAPVTAPHAGTVVFTGDFMDYGNMVIIQHDKTYHSVIAGLDVIEVESGQTVGNNNVIGVMGNTALARQLYYELRKHSKAIDPADWMGKVSNVAIRE